MIKEGKFGTHEGICLIIIVITTKVFFTSPAVLVSFVGTAGWYMTLISAATGMLGFVFIYFLLKRFPGKNIVEIYELSLGKILGFIFSSLLALHLMFSGAAMLREYTEVLKVYALPMSPPSYIIAIFVLVVVVLCYLGLESIVRFSKLTAYLLLIGLAAVLVLSWQNYEFHRIFPIWGHGIMKTIQHGVLRSSVYGEAIILAVIASSLQGTKHIKKAGFTGIALSGILISAALLAFSLAFPYFTAAEVTAPMYQLTTLIDYGKFVQRLDPVFLLIWNIGTFISVTAVFYAALSIYCKMFRIQDMRPLILPAAIILFSLAMIPNDITEVATGYTQRFREYGWVIFYVLPLIALVVAKIRNKKGGIQVA